MTRPESHVHNIVFATDFSPSSGAAEKVAIDYAAELGARLHVLHVTLGSAGKKHLDNLKGIKENIPSSIDAVTAVETGNPAKQIVRYAERVGADLIVMGTHGRTGVTRALMGSVTERVVRTANCPVLTVPMWMRARRAERAAPAPAPEPQHCIVCRKTSEDLICEECRDRIRAESLDHKLKEMHKGTS
jgi:nucleotide-binding universal stress UspA family protein